MLLFFAHGSLFCFLVRQQRSSLSQQKRSHSPRIAEAPSPQPEKPAEPTPAKPAAPQPSAPAPSPAPAQAPAAPAPAAPAQASPAPAAAAEPEAKPKESPAAAAASEQPAEKKAKVGAEGTPAPVQVSQPKDAAEGEQAAEASPAPPATTPGSGRGGPGATRAFSAALAASTKPGQQKAPLAVAVAAAAGAGAPPAGACTHAVRGAPRRLSLTLTAAALQSNSLLLPWIAAAAAPKPKETPSRALRVDGLTRPFTLKQLKEEVLVRGLSHAAALPCHCSLSPSFSSLWKGSGALFTE